MSYSVRASITGLLMAVLAGMYPAAAQPSQIVADTMAGRFDNGKMWTFEYPPSEYFSETYGFKADDEWFERARLGALRIPGCSAAFVSPHGLIVTNHHCVRGPVTRVSRPGENLLDEGFYASSLDTERPIPDYYADQLIGIEDVTEGVVAAEGQGGTDAEREQQRQEILAQLGQELTDRYRAGGTDVHVEVKRLYHGGRYSAYVFRRYEDLRLVAAPEEQLGFFGGDPDNFTYPRYALDFSFLRIYDENGQPLESPNHFDWGREGVDEGDVVFVIGNPGPTDRLNTVAQLEYQRDVSLPAVTAFLESHLAALRAYIANDPEDARRLGLHNRAFSLSNSLKSTSGSLSALRDPVILARRRDAERKFREAIASHPELRAEYEGVFEQMADLQEQKKALAPLYSALLGLTNNASSPLLRRALAVRAYLAARQSGTALDSLAPLRQEILALNPFERDLEVALIAARLAAIQYFLGQEHEITQSALRGMTPEQAAADLFERSVFTDSASTVRILDDGNVPENDPAWLLIQEIVPPYQALAQKYDQLEAAEAELASRLGRALFEVYGTGVPPDATFSPRITDGVVQGYAYNGTEAPPFTTFFGLYDRYYAFGEGSEWDLPDQWVPVPPGLDMNTPLNFVSTADTYGGNSGSPAITPDLKLVGLNFDRNIEALSRDFIYLPERGRNIMVDVRAIQEALDDVYDADRIVQELLTKQLYVTEQEADTAARP